VPETALFWRWHPAKKRRAAEAIAQRIFGNAVANETRIEVARHYVPETLGKEMAGYSKTPLAQKLGIKAGAKVVALNAPAGYRKWLAPLPEGVSFGNRTIAGSTFVHLFVTKRRSLERELNRLRKLLADAGVLWVSWPKKSSGVATDITEDVIRDICLPLGLVDVKVCAVDETWSGLKLMIRRENRRQQSSHSIH
jgi:hypothetical protein